MTSTPTLGLVHDLDEDAYHADTETLSVTGAKMLLHSPALYQWRRTHEQQTATFDTGKAAHAIALGKGAKLHIVDADSFRTKAAQEERDAARARGEVPMLPKAYAEAEAMAEALTSHRIAGKLLQGGQAEVSAYALHERTGVTRRCRFDYLNDFIVDVKTAENAQPAAFARAAAKYHYHQQHPWYVDVARACDLDVRGFLFVVVTKEPPHLVSVCELTEVDVELGRRRNERALEIFRDCREANVWPDWTDDQDIHEITLPKWVHHQEEYE